VVSSVVAESLITFDNLYHNHAFYITSLFSFAT
jgi:hypothetical protein